MNEFTFLSKSKNLVTKNIKNAEEHIADLNKTLDKLRTDKYNLTLSKNNLLQETENLEDILLNIDPDFLEKMNRQGKLTTP